MHELYGASDPGGLLPVSAVEEGEPADDAADDISEDAEDIFGEDEGLAEKDKDAEAGDIPEPEEIAEDAAEEPETAGEDEDKE